MKQISLIIIFLVYLIISECSSTIPDKTNNNLKPVPTVSIVKTNTTKKTIPKKNISLYFYKHFSGKINEKEIVMSLNRNINDLYGYYFYKNINKEISLSGTIDSNNNIILNEYNQKNIHTGTFTGIIKNDTIFLGTWINHEKTKKVKFHVQEDYSNSMKFKIFKNETTYHLYQVDSFPYYSVEIKFLIPVKNANNKLLDNFTKKYLEFFFGKKLIENTVIETLNTLTDTLINVYKNFNELPDLDKKIYMENQWEYLWDYSAEWNIVYNDNYLLSISQNYYEYTGGAHGYNAFSFFNYDLKKDKQILITDIIQKDKKEELNTIIKKIIQENKVNDHRYEMLFSIDDVYVTNNFYLNLNGIGFVYNPYEIAPYSAGVIDVFVEYSKIKQIMK